MSQREFLPVMLIMTFLFGFMVGGFAGCSAMLPHVDTVHMQDGKTWRNCK